MDLPRKLVSAMIERSRRSGKMITKLLEWEIDFLLRYCCTLKVAPFQWDPVTRVLGVLDDRSWGYMGWAFSAILSLLHCGLMWLRFYVSVQKSDSFVTLTWIFFIGTCASILATCQMAIYLHASDLANFFNSYTLVFKRIEGKYWKPGAVPFGRFMETMIGCIILAGLTQTNLVAVFYWFKPLSKIFLVSSTFLDENSSTILIFLAVIPVYWFFTFGWATVMLMTGIFVQFNFLLVFVTKNISANYRGSRTLNRLRIPLVAFKIYSSLQLLTHRANEISQSILFMIVNLTLTLVVVGNNLLIVFHSSLSTLLFLAIGTSSLIGFLVLIVIYVILAQVHEHSKIFVRSWKVKLDYSVSEKKRFLKLFKSCRLNRIEMGSFGCFKKPSVIRIFGKVVLFTAKLLLLLAPHAGDSRGLG